MLDFCKVCFTFCKSNFTIMKAKFLFPHYFKFIGIGCILIHLPIVLIRKAMDWHFDHSDAHLFDGGHIFYIITILLVVVGLLMVAFSKEKIEDEQITQLRLDALQWAIYFNYFVLIISLVFTKDRDAIDMLKINLWMPLVFFILLFRWKLYRNNQVIKEDAIWKTLFALSAL